MTPRTVEKKNYTVLVLDEPVQLDFILQIDKLQDPEGNVTYVGKVLQWSLDRQHRFLLLLFRHILRDSQLPLEIHEIVVKAILEDVNDCLDVWY